MGLVSAVISCIGAIFGAAVVKVIAEDAKEWTPWVTRCLLAFAVRKLPELQRERYSEEWAAHLAEVPGVVGKLAVAVQFQIAAFWARELDAKARLNAWRIEQATVWAEIQAMTNGVLTMVPARFFTEEVDEPVVIEHINMMYNVLTDVLRRWDEINARRPALGITMATANDMTDRMFITTGMKIRLAAITVQNCRISARDGILRMLGRLDQ